MWATPHIASACTCRQLPPEQAQAVFEGRVLGPPTIEKTISETTANYEFSVSQVWKGDVSKTVTIKVTPSILCGITYVPGETYLVYAAPGGENFLRDEMCSGTRPSDSASEDFARLGPGLSPVRAREKTKLQTVSLPRVRASTSNPTVLAELIGCRPNADHHAWALLLFALGVHC
ncbi:MAG: hypothetical protein ACPG4T_12345 [Nannocystaceae bacterium]